MGRPHGLAGEVTVLLHTDRAERTEPGAVLHAGDRPLVVEAARPFKKGWLVRFVGVIDRDSADALRGAVLSAEPLDALEGEVWVHELTDCEVCDRSGRSYGRVVAVQANPAHDLLVLDDGRLVPMVFVVEHEPGRVVVEVPSGLLD